jgi:hypothetical protein
LARGAPAEIAPEIAWHLERLGEPGERGFAFVGPEGGKLLLAALDVHPRVAMAILRHSRIALTMEIYTQVPDKTTRDALRRLSDWLGQGDDEPGPRGGDGQEDDDASGQPGPQNGG